MGFGLRIAVLLETFAVQIFPDLTWVRKVL
jgi:hypothetical protein